MEIMLGMIPSYNNIAREHQPYQLFLTNILSPTVWMWILIDKILIMEENANQTMNVYRIVVSMALVEDNSKVKLVLDIMTAILSLDANQSLFGLIKAFANPGAFMETLAPLTMIVIQKHFAGISIHLMLQKDKRLA